MTSHRACPIPFANSAPPTCRWCGEDVGRRARWHRSCFQAYLLHSRRKIQFEFVANRDGLKCHCCGETPTKWQIETPILPGRVNHDGLPLIWTKPLGTYSAITRVSALELEHVQPLWKIRHLPVAERLPFYGPTNLKLQAPDCHKLKTAREAAERAHYEALANPKPPRRKKRIASPGFNKTLTRRFDRTVVSRPAPRASGE